MKQLDLIPKQCYVIKSVYYRKYYSLSQMLDRALESPHITSSRLRGYILSTPYHMQRMDELEELMFACIKCSLRNEVSISRKYDWIGM